MLPQNKILQTINELSRISFAILFVVLRMICFPYVAIYVGVLPDCLKAIQQEKPQYTTPLLTIATFSILFTIMQLYWGSLVVKQIVKALTTGGGGGGGGGGGDNKDNSEGSSSKKKE